MIWEMFQVEETEEKPIACPSICMPFLNGACEKTCHTCTDIHARHPFLWQSQYKGQWQSFPQFHSEELEVAFRVVHGDGVHLSPIDTHTGEEFFDPSMSWYANFEKMTLDQGKKSLKIRRLSTVSAVLSNNVMATQFEWFVKDENSRWVKFGATNSKGKAMSSSVTASDDIERYYCQNSGKKEMFIASDKQEYVLNFDKMTQSDESGVVGPIRRRVKVAPITAGSGSSSDLSPEATASAAASKVAPAKVSYQWQFKDSNNAWITYGDASTANEPGCVSNTTSEEIEEHFKNFPSSVLVISSQQHQCELDFQSMTQVNQKTLVKRDVRRIQVVKPVAKNKVANSRTAYRSSKTIRSPKVAFTNTRTALTRMEKGSSNPKKVSTSYKWQFQDGHNSWITYGKASTENEPGCVTSSSSDDIEEHYKSSPATTLVINSQKHQYVLDFQNMTQTNQQTSVQRPIRRISVALNVQQENGSNAGKVTYEWQFQDSNNVWIAYGQPATANEQGCVTNTTSEEIEEHYNEAPDSVLVIRSQQYQYELDFKTMTQTNVKTLVQRPMRRVVRTTPKIDSKIYTNARLSKISTKNSLDRLGHLRVAHAKHVTSTPNLSPREKDFPDEEYEWFFLDEKNAWIKYGQSNTQKNLGCVPSVTSDDIEKHYSEDPAKCMIIESKENKYFLDFVKMKQINKHTQVERPISRRLKNSASSQGDVSLDMTVKAVYEWFFKNDHDSWTKFGLVPGTNAVDYACNTTSDDIEKHYSKNPKQPLDIKCSDTKYTLDFVKMTQKNKTTYVERKVCRRAKIISMTGASGDSTRALPSYWTPMTPNEFVKTVLLTSTDGEYIKNMAFIRKTHPSFQIKQMYRIQNPFLWRAFVNMKECKKQKNPGVQLREEHLFHSTGASKVKSICEDNLDWRLHGTSAGQNQGRGSYFSNDAAFSASYGTEPLKAMFIVKVLIGQIAQGNANTIRPQSSGGVNFDTTVDNVTTPKIFVKYDSQEYYPEYYVEYQ